MKRLTDKQLSSKIEVNGKEGKMLKELTLADLGWIGGFFDGEGTFTIAKKKPNLKHREVSYLYQPKVQVACTDERPIKWLKENVGGNYYRYAPSQRGRNHRDFYRWEVYGQAIVEFIDTILPYLRIKQEAAQVVRNLQKRVTGYRYRFYHRGRGNGRGYQPMAKEEVEAREKMYCTIRLLNKRGR